MSYNITGTTITLTRGDTFEAWSLPPKGTGHSIFRLKAILFALQ